MSVASKMTAMANSIRALLGLTGTMGLDAMVTHISTEKTNVDNALSAIAGKGVEVPSGANSGNLAALIASITGGGDSALAESIIYRTIESYEDESITRIEAGVFMGCTKLGTLITPSVTAVAAYACDGCKRLEEVSLPLVQTIGDYAFRDCVWLEEIDTAHLTTIGAYAFDDSSLETETYPNVLTVGTGAFRDAAMQKADFEKVTSIGANAFYGIYDLYTLIIRTPTVCKLVNKNAFTDAAVAEGEGYIYVPSSLVDSYKAATNWSTYADQIRAIEDYPNITGG